MTALPQATLDKVAQTLDRKIQAKNLPEFMQDAIKWARVPADHPLTTQRALEIHAEYLLGQSVGFLIRDVVAAQEALKDVAEFKPS